MDQSPPAPTRADAAAQRSLADALGASFGVLKIVMLLALVIYALSGTYRVEPQQAAVQLVFGNIVGEGDASVRDDGLHFGWPYPIGEVIKVPTDQQNLLIPGAFMFEINQQNLTQSYDQMTGRALNPERDGSLITGDADLVHAMFTVTYTITNPADFIATLGASEDDAPAGADSFQTSRERIEPILSSIVEEAIVSAVASARSDDVVASRANTDVAAAQAQDVLDTMNAGITIDQILIRDPTMPISVRDAYSLVSQAEGERREAINEAETARREALGQAGGAAALPGAGGGDGALVRLIKDYELAVTAGDDAEASALRERLDTAFRDLRIELTEDTFDIGGDAAAVINQAQTDRTARVQQTQVEAEAFAELLPRYRENPELFRALLVEGARSRIFGDGSDIETFVTPQGRMILELNRDPQVTQQRELQRRAELEAELQGG